MSNLCDSVASLPSSGLFNANPEKTKVLFLWERQSLKTVLLGFIPYPERADTEVITVKFRKFLLKPKNAQAERKNRASAGLFLPSIRSKGNRSLVRSAGLSKATWENMLLSSQLASKYLRCVQHVLHQGVSKKVFQPECEPG